MSPRFPSLRPERVIRTFEKFGFIILRQKGSHVFLYKEDSPPISIPCHKKDIKKGLILAQLKRVQISPESFLGKY